MKERPLIFTGPSIRAILEGRKSQTRRIMRPQPELVPEDVWNVTPARYKHGDYWWRAAKAKSMVEVRDAHALGPYGVPGDRVYAKETWSTRACTQHDGGVTDQPCTCRPVLYAADFPEPSSGKRPGGWRTPLYMARRDARIVLELTRVRVERLQEITEEDAVAEGMDNIKAKVPRCRDVYSMTWDAIHARGAPEFLWTANPFVWALSFRVLEVRKAAAA
jgi:hypothetical protein